MNKHLHIVTHDVPYPADFGGVVDIFYKLKYLHQLGIKIHLHCFVKNRAAQPVLENYCETVTYYKRKGLLQLSLKLPFIVASRKSDKLLQHLLQNDYPILFEGIHTTYHLHKSKLDGRKTFVRLFNVEHIYYKHLAKNEANLFLKAYFNFESTLLLPYEKRIAKKTHVLTLSTKDSETYTKNLGAPTVSFVPAFIPYQQLTSLLGSGMYCLYHGNLAISENEKAVIWLVENIFSVIGLPFVVAGRNPTNKLKKLVKCYQNVSLVATPSEVNLQLLIQHAQINVLPSFNDTGVKLKLLNALYNGRHCLVNAAGTEGSGLNGLCEIAETAEDFLEKIQILFNEPFSEKEMQRRSSALNVLYNNEVQARFIYDAIP